MRFRLERMRRLAPGAYESFDGRFYTERTDCRYVTPGSWLVRDETVRPHIEQWVMTYNDAREWIRAKRSAALSGSAGSQK